MAKDYNTFSDVSTGDVYTAAAHNLILENVENYRVPPMAIADRSAALNHTSSGSYQAVTFDTETLDTDSMIDIAGNPTRITVATAGIYAVNFIAACGATSGIIATAIYKNGSPVAFLQSKAAHAATSYMTGAAYLSLAATDYVEGFIYQNTGGSVAMDGNLSCIWLGQAS